MLKAAGGGEVVEIAKARPIEERAVGVEQRVAAIGQHGDRHTIEDLPLSANGCLDFMPGRRVGIRDRRELRRRSRWGLRGRLFSRAAITLDERVFR